MLMIMIIFIIFYYYYYQRQLLALFRLWGTLRGEQWLEKSWIEFPPTGGVRHLWSWQDFEFWVFFFSEWGYHNYDLNLNFGKNKMMFPSYYFFLMWVCGDCCNFLIKALPTITTETWYPFVLINSYRDTFYYAPSPNPPS